MEILVCVKRVPETSENKIELDSSGADIDRSDLVYAVNEWDNYAVEEAIQIVERVGGCVTVASVGDEDCEETLRRELAMGAGKALLLSDGAFEGLDGRGVATVLAAAVRRGKYDLVLTGTQADDGAAQVGGMLAALLDYPFASLVNKIVVEEGGTLTVGREVEGGAQELSRIGLPCVLSIQTGINEPRYVGIRGIRQVASVEIPVLGAADLGLGTGDLAPRVRREGYFLPETGKGAEMLEGDMDEIVVKLLELLEAKGGLK